jgi:N6-L-threonylcarbamoyladenine synthase
MEKQLTDTILMIEPVAFGFNEDTAQNNFFQQQDCTPENIIQQKVLSEFSAMVRQGNPEAFKFSKPHIPGYDYSFSGLKTSFLYSLRDWMKEDPDFVEHHKTDLAASLEKTIVDILMDKLRKVVKDTGIKEVAVAGGVSANNGLRNAFREHAKKYGWNIFIPKFGYTTDNAAMIAITGYYKFLDKDFCTIDKPAYSRVTIK